MDVDFPYCLDSRGRTAATGADDHVRDMIEQLLFTSPGERVMRPDFGSGLSQMVFAPTGPEIATAIQFALQAALQKWLGDLIAVQQLSVTAIDSTLTVSLSYLVRATSQLQNATFTRSV